MGTIHSNGSKWAGEPLDTLEQLLTVLSTEPLDPVFLQYGGFREVHRGQAHYLGNFLNVSHVFRITCDLGSETDTKLSRAVALNLLRPDFVAALTDNSQTLWQKLCARQRKGQLA